jgi:hypothetical protein
MRFLADMGVDIRVIVKGQLGYRRAVLPSVNMDLL